MGIIANNAGPAVGKNETVVLDLRDMELILRHLRSGEFKGSEIPQAYMTMTKLQTLHNSMVEQGVDFNAVKPDRKRASNRT